MVVVVLTRLKYPLLTGVTPSLFSVPIPRVGRPLIGDGALGHLGQ